jgi:polar amino acid transport system substrate-binding protein
MCTFLASPRRGPHVTNMTMLLLACSAASFLAQSQAAPLRLVSTSWPPFTNGSGQPRFALDLVETALGRVGMSAQTMIVSPAEFTASLLSPRFDGSAAAWKDPEREQVLMFSEPYLENRLVLVGRRGADVSAKTLSALKGKRVAIVEGYSYGDAIDGAVDRPTYVRSGSEEDSVSQLLKGNVEYTLMDELVVQYIVEHYPKESGTRLQIGSTPLVTRALYLAVRRSRPDAGAIIMRFNAQLRSMIADRTYHRLLHVDWIQADVNGDGVPENVPVTDHPGPSEPQRVYALLSTPPNALTTTKPDTSSTKPGFYVGGNIYSDWASVPASYKEVNPDPPDSRRSTASIFKFSW